jgi:adenylate cyclase
LRGDRPGAILSERQEEGGIATIADFAHKLGLVLKACNLSRGRLARTVGVDKSVVSRWTSGIQAPSDHNLVLLTEAVGRYRPGFARADWELALSAFGARLGLDEALSENEPGSTLPQRPSIAVLPFTNMSGDPEQEYFADGIVEEITTVLGRLKSLFVIARNSSFTYKGKAVDVKQVGRELGVRYVLEGSVRRSGNRVRVTAQLIDAGSGSHLWADSFDGVMDDIFDLHGQVATSVAGAVEPTLREAEINSSLRKPTTSLSAYDLYMRAMAAFRTVAPDSLRTSLELTGRAIDLDPNFGRALALKALCLMHLHTDDGPAARSAEALRLAQAALAANDDWEALTTGAMVMALMGGNVDAALVASQRALTLNPNGYLALMHNGWIHNVAGSPSAAIEPFTRALRLSPRDPLLGYGELGLAVAHRDLGRATEALSWARRAILSLPLLAGGYRTMAVALVDLGRIDEAKEAIGQLLKALPKESLRPDLLYRQNRNRATAEGWIAALQRAGLPE